MNLTEYISIVTLILVVANLITIWLLHHRTYKFEYYKQLIAKRLAAYEQLDTVIQMLNQKMKFPDDFSYHSILKNETTFENFLAEFWKAGKFAHWYSIDLKEKFDNLNTRLNKISDEIDTTTTHDTIKIGINNFSQLERDTYVLELFMIKDYKELHKVDYFFKDHFRSIPKKLFKNFFKS